ncbi:MAG: hypothetical protein V3T08_03210 [Gemmatimonadota bacterium]
MTGVKVVYIAGCSFSGSTLLGLLLGSQDRAVYAGELKQFWRPPKRHVPGHFICTCGRSYESCAFWARVCDLRDSSTDPNPPPDLHWRNLLFFGRLLTPLPLGRPTPTAYGALVKMIHWRTAADGRAVEYLVDSSKSIAALDELARSPNVKTYVIHLVRDGKAVVDSFKRRGFGRWRGMITWSAVNLLLLLYLRRRKLPRLRLDYGALCLDTATQCHRLNAFLGLELSPDSLLDDVRSSAYHVFRANMSRASGWEFAGLRYRGRMPATNWADRLLAALAVAPLNRLLGITPRTHFHEEPGA